MRSSVISFSLFVFIGVFISSANANFYLPVPELIHILCTNDDSVYEANLRASCKALTDAGYRTATVANAENESGTGSKTAAPTEVTNGCFLDGCPKNSPPTACGPNTSLNLTEKMCYVNAYPADAVNYAYNNVSTALWGWGQKAILTVAGPNVGLNTGSTVLVSGTVNAAAVSAVENGIPALAISGDVGDYEPFTILNDPSLDKTAATAADNYAQLSLKLTNALLLDGLNFLSPVLPEKIVLNVNMDPITNCTSSSDYRFVLTRIYEATNTTAPDVPHCGTTRLPYERQIMPSNGHCLVTVSVMNATTKNDVGAEDQLYVLNKLSSILTCAPPELLA